MQFAVLLHKCRQTSHESLGQRVTEPKLELEVDGNKQNRNRVVMLREEVIEQSYELGRSVEGVVEIRSRTRVTPHRQTAHLLSVLWSSYTSFRLPGGVSRTGLLVRQGRVELEISYTFLQQLASDVEVVEGVCLIGERTSSQ